MRRLGGRGPLGAVGIVELGPAVQLIATPENWSTIRAERLWRAAS
jgi:hypothetical protein